MSPTAGVVIPTLDRPALVGRCLAAVLAGTRPPDAVLICDQSRDLRAREAVAVLALSDRRVRYRHLARANASGARNAGLAALDTDLVAFIDDDCVAGAGWLAALVDGYTRQAAAEPVAAVTGRVLPLYGGAGEMAVSTRDSRQRRVYRAAEGGMQRGAWAPWDIGTGANILAPRAALAAIGGFDPRLGPGTRAYAAEDIDLLYRLTRRGAVVYEPAAVVYHPAGPRRGRWRSRYRYGAGMGYLLGRHMAAGDPTARVLLRLYLRLRLSKLLSREVRQAPERGLVLAGAARALLQVLVLDRRVPKRRRAAR